MFIDGLEVLVWLHDLNQNQKTNAFPLVPKLWFGYRIATKTKKPKRCRVFIDALVTFFRFCPLPHPLIWFLGYMSSTPRGVGCACAWAELPPGSSALRCYMAFGIVNTALFAVAPLPCESKLTAPRPIGGGLHRYWLTITLFNASLPEPFPARQKQRGGSGRLQRGVGCTTNISTGCTEE